ncbi:MAG: hypothetical protein RL750_681, partial [Bacteroidota bacterium]
MMCLVNEFFRQVFDQFFFDGQWGGGGSGHESQAMADAEHVCIHGHIGLFV